MRGFADVYFSRLKKRDAQTQPQEVWIHQREYFHDVAVITLHNEASNRAKYKAGMPVQVRYGWLPHEIEYFHGYVHHTEHTEHVGTASRDLVVYAIGASFPCKQTSTKIWKKATKRHIVATIAKKYRLSSVIEDDKLVMPTIAQHGQSDWDFLVHLAQRAGYTFFVNKTDLHFRKREADLNPAHAPAFLKHKRAHHYHRSSVYHFVHEVGETLPGTHRKVRKVQGVTDSGKHVTYLVNPDNCDVLGTVAPPVLFGEHLDARPVHSTKEASNYLADLNARFRFHYKAKAELSGDVRVRQSSTIRLHGIDRNNDGYWYVTQVSHHITKSDYRIEVELGRDAMGNAVPPAPITTGVTGKPIVYDGCSDFPIDDPTSDTPPDTVFVQPEDCAPLDGSDDLSDNLPDPDDPDLVAVVAKKNCSCCTGKLTVPHRPHLGVWKAKHTVVRKPTPKRTRILTSTEPLKKRPHL